MRRDTCGDAVFAGSYVGSPSVISLSVSSARTGPLTADAVYRIWSSVDAFFAFGDATVTASTSSHPIKAGLDLIHVVNSNLYIAAIVSSGTGQLFISRYDTTSDNP